MKGAAEKMDMARPRSFAVKTSAITPPAFVSGLDPKAAAKNRRIRSPYMFGPPAAAALKATNAVYVPTKTSWRP
jgi:hypothetical protein